MIDHLTEINEVEYLKVNDSSIYAKMSDEEAEALVEASDREVDRSKKVIVNVPDYNILFRNVEGYIDIRENENSLYLGIVSKINETQFFEISFKDIINIFDITRQIYYSTYTY